MSIDYTEKGSGQYYSDPNNYSSMETDFSKRMDPTTYNKNKQEEAKKARVAEMAGEIAKAEVDSKDIKGKNTIHGMMDFVERLIYRTGGENKVTFLDVTHSFMKIQTRVPLSANVFPFMPDDNNNTRYHKVVTKILLLCPVVTGVRWLSADTGSYLLISMDLSKGAAL